MFFDDLHMPWNIFCERRNKKNGLIPWHAERPSTLQDWDRPLLSGGAKPTSAEKGPVSTLPCRRALGQWHCQGVIFSYLWEEKKTWKWMLILMISRPQYSYRVREDLWNTPPVTEAHRVFRGMVPGILEISWDFHEISFATMMEYKPALDILAPRASIYLGGLDGEHILGRVGGANPSYTATICSAKLESLSNPPG